MTGNKWHGNKNKHSSAGFVGRFTIFTTVTMLLHNNLLGEAGGAVGSLRGASSTQAE
jgi:hypothetical protein